MALSSSMDATQTVRGQYLLLELCLPEASLKWVGAPVGVLLLDPRSDRLHVRIADEWPDGLSAADRELLVAVGQELRERATEESGAGLLAWLEDCFSHTLRLSERQVVLLPQVDGDAEAGRQADSLFQKQVGFPRYSVFENSAECGSTDSVEEAGTAKRATATDGAAAAGRHAEVIPFRTHLPFYPMRIAAGMFSRDTEVEASAWVPLPQGLRAGEGYFVARIAGHSMEPSVPDGSFCLFRAQPQGSREGKLLLVQKYGVSESGGEFTIKRYHSEKAVLPAGAAEEFDDAPEWRHSRVRLISLNPSYPSWDLEADQCQVIAEFVRVLDEEEIPGELHTN